MTTFDYLLSLLGLAAVLIAMRRRELTDRRLRLQLVIAGLIAAGFLHGVPTAGADGVLVMLGVATGAACAMIGAHATTLELTSAGTVVAHAGRLAFAVTILAFGGRMAFAFAADHGLGPDIARFSASVGIHSQHAWVAALVLMAVTDIALRAAILWVRRSRLAATGRTGVLTARSCA
ncbi:MAG TPA: hypothetical protein VII98_08055 [Solirubrobacteraceae bacterium]